MPARSRSQQRLFAMVHAYNKGELHCGRSLRKRVVDLAGRISDDDARDFARTKHDGLPERKEEKKAQVMVRPETMQALYAQVPVGEYVGAAIPASVRSERRRSFLGSVLYGTGAGAILGGLGAAGLGALVANHAARESGLSDTDARSRMLEAAAKLGLWGAGRGAMAGSAVGAGLGVLDKIRG